MADDEKKALQTLQNLAIDAASGLAEESEVYRVAENIVDNNKYLFGTVNSILNKELGISFDVGKNKNIGFKVKPNEASLGFKMSFDSGGKIGFANAGMVEELAEMTVGGAFDRMIKVGTEGSQADYRSGRNMTQKILKEIFPDVDNVMNIKMKDLTLTDAENFIKKADELKIGKNVIEKFRYAFTVSGRSPKSGMNLITTIQDTPGRMDELYTRGTQVVGTPLQNFGEKDEVIKNVDNWINTKMNPAFKGTVEGSNVRLAKIVSETGLRPVDIIRLRPTDIDFENGFIRYMSAKGAAGKNLPVTDEVLNLFKQQWNAVGTDNISKHGGRLFGRINSKNTIVSAAQDAKDYESNWSKQFRKAFKKGELQIFDDATKSNRAFRLYDFRSYHAAKLIEANQGGLANDIMGWKSGKEEKIPSKMLQTVYGQTADRQLKVVMSEESIKLKNAVNAKQKIIYDNIGKTSTSKIIPDTKIDEQVENLKKPKDVSTESKSISKKGDIDAEGKLIVEEKPSNVKLKDIDTTKTLQQGDTGAFSKETIAKYLKKYGKYIKGAAWLTGGLSTAQLLNELSGGKLLGTVEAKETAIGPVETTLSGEAKSLLKLTTDAIYPKGHPKEGKAIHSTKEYEQLKKHNMLGDSQWDESKINMPEQLEEFDQQNRL